MNNDFALKVRDMGKLQLKTLDAVREEIKRLKVMKNEKTAPVLNSLREKINALWARCGYDDARKAEEFSECSVELSVELTATEVDTILQKHRSYFSKLEQLYKSQPLCVGKRSNTGRASEAVRTPAGATTRHIQFARLPYRMRVA